MNSRIIDHRLVQEKYLAAMVEEAPVRNRAREKWMKLIPDSPRISNKEFITIYSMKTIWHRDLLDSSMEIEAVGRVFCPPDGNCPETNSIYEFAYIEIWESGYDEFKELREFYIQNVCPADEHEADRRIICDLMDVSPHGRAYSDDRQVLPPVVIKLEKGWPASYLFKQVTIE